LGELQKFLFIYFDKILTLKGCAIFWAIFSQTHLVSSPICSQAPMGQLRFEHPSTWRFVLDRGVGIYEGLRVGQVFVVDRPGKRVLGCHRQLKQFRSRFVKHELQNSCHSTPSAATDGEGPTLRPNLSKLSRLWRSKEEEEKATPRDTIAQSFSPFSA
jgi:hypothetical protein